MPLPTDQEGWQNLATDVLEHFLEARTAVVRPEAEAWLAERGWVHQHHDGSVPPARGPQPHHLTVAHRRLAQAGLLVEEPAELQGRSVTAWVHGPALSSGTATEARKAAASKRRRYRSYLAWAANARLCGAVAERVVHASIKSLAGSTLWVPPIIEPGRVTEIAGDPITVGGPLDSAGYWARDPVNPAAGLIPFAVEVKNIRSWLYPWDDETWDLLAKLGTHPHVVPVLVARRVHYITFRFFKDIGALAHQTGTQWFHNAGTARASINVDAFADVTRELGFHDATLIEDPDSANSRVTRFFRETIYRPVEGAESLATRAESRWERTAPIVAQYTELRESSLAPQERAALWDSFCGEIIDAGLYDADRWAPRHFTA